MKNTERKVELWWEDLAEILRKHDLAFHEEEIREITLMKPKRIRLYLRKKTEGKSDVLKQSVS